MKHKGWTVYQLSDAGEKLTDLDALRRDLLARGALEVFIPAYVSTNTKLTEIVYLYEGYLFARMPESCHQDLETSPYIQEMLTIPYTSNGSDRHEPAFVPDRQVRKIREQLRQTVPHFKIGDEVRVIHGTYSNLVGRVTFDPELGIQDRVRAVLSDGEPRTCRAVGEVTGLTSPQVNTPLQKLRKSGLVEPCGDQHWRWTGDPPEELAIAIEFASFRRIISVPLLFLDVVDTAEP